jgi:hypothetical protein
MTTPCVNYPQVYDDIEEGTRGMFFNRAVEAARNLCGGCPIMAACHAEHADERWVRAIHNRPLTFTKPESRPDRIEDLEHLAANGARLHEAAAKLGLSPAALRKWCERNGCMDLYRVLAPTDWRAA